MASVVRGVLKAIKEKGIVNFAKDLIGEGYLHNNGIYMEPMTGNFYIYHSHLRGQPSKYIQILASSSSDDKELDSLSENCLLDGNLLQTKIHNIGATLVGVDKFGNKYYERLDIQYGRHRWVEYAQKDRYNASQVPPEWHGWLHYVSDHTGDELLMLKPNRYGVEHKENFSGEGEEFIYHSKGHALNPGQRNWTRYRPWLPTKTYF